MKKLLLFLILFFSVSLHAGNVPDWAKLTANIERILTTNSDSALFQIGNTEKLYKGKDSLFLQAHLHSLRAIIYIHKSNFNAALKQNQISYNLNRNANFQYGLAYNYYIFAQYWHRKSNYVKAVELYHKSYTACNNTNNHNLIHAVYIGLSGVYLDQMQYDKALEYANKSASLYKISENEYQYINALSFIAETYRMSGDNEKAEKYFEKVFNLVQKSGYKLQEAWILSNWSLLYDSDLIKSTKMTIDAQKIFDSIAPLTYNSVNNIGNLGWSYYMIAMKDSLLTVARQEFGIPSRKACLDMSETCYTKAIKLSKESKTPNIYLFFSYSLSELQAYRGNFKDAYYCLLEHKMLSDSVYSQANKNKISELENARKIALKDSEIKIHKLIIENNKKQKIFFLILVVLLAVIGLLMFFQNKRRKENNHKLQIINNELVQANYVKSRFFNILNHDLRSPLAHIIHFYNFKKDIISASQGVDVEKIENNLILKAQNLLHSMDDLLLWGKSQMESFNPVIEQVPVESVFEYISSHFSYLENYTIEFKNPEKSVLNTDGNILKAIVRNLTANAVNAIDKQDNRCIEWGAVKRNNKVVLSITDSGNCADRAVFAPLFDEKKSVGIKNGLGLHLIRELANSIQLTLNVDDDSRKGTRIELIF